MKAKIIEIFSSIQGEGKYVGLKQVFVRFFGCPLNCIWCDTPSEKSGPEKDFQEMSVPDVASVIRALGENCHSVSLTGGEPLLYPEFLKELLQSLKPYPARIFLETNGVLFDAFQEISDQVDIVSMDFKLPSSTLDKPLWEAHERFLSLAAAKEVSVKAVISHKTEIADIQKAVEIIARIDDEICFVLQPNFYDLQKGILDRCRRFQEYCLKHLKDVRIIPQVHRLLNIK